jgi:hypothetical protein
MWKIIVALLIGCANYLSTPVVMDGDEVSPHVLSGPSVAGSIVVTVAAYCVLWLAVASVRRLRTRRQVAAL